MPASSSSVGGGDIIIILQHVILRYHFHTSLQREEKVYKWYNSTAISAQECINKKWR